jgi:hypothetical protein
VKIRTQNSLRHRHLFTGGFRAFRYPLPLPVRRDRAGVRVIWNVRALRNCWQRLCEYKWLSSSKSPSPQPSPGVPGEGVLCAIACILLSSPVLLPADSTTTSNSVYFNSFEHSPKGKPDDEFTILNGDFSIREEAGNSFLELPGDPLDTFGLLFGPGDSPTLDVSARIWADSAGKRLPEFGIGSNDTGGYKLWLWPANGTIELRKADDAKASKPFSWKPATWLRCRLRVRQVGPKLWRIEGKAWPDGTPEPADWLLSFDDTEEPTAGKASIWGVPFSGKPIRFDDLSVKPAR